MSRVFPSNICYGISPEIREEQRRRPVGGGDGGGGGQSDSVWAGQDVTQVGWSSAPPSCSPAAGCGTPGRRPGRSRPD